MFGDDFDDLEVLNRHLTITHLTGHTHTLEDLGGIGAGTYRTGGAKTVVLAVCALAYTTEAVTLNDALVALTFADAYYVNEIALVEQFGGDGVSGAVLSFETLELGQVSLGCYTGFLEVTQFGGGKVFFLLIAEAELYGIIAVLSHSLDLCNHARTYFDNSAWNVLSLGTENGCHSDFLS